MLAALAALLLAGLVRVSVAPVGVPARAWAEAELTRAAGTPVHVSGVGVRLVPFGVALTLEEVRLRTAALSASVDRISLVQGFSGRVLRLGSAAVRVDPSRGAGEPPKVPHPDEALAALDDALAAVAAHASAHGARSLSVRRGRLDVVSAGRPIDEARVFQDIEATVEIAGSGALAGRLSTVGAAGPVTLALERTVAADGAVRLALEAAGVSPRDVARVGPVQGGFRVAPRLDAAFAPDGTVTRADLRLEIGPGTVMFGKDPPRSIDGARVRLVRAADGDSLDVAEASLRAGRTRVELAGSVFPAPVAGEAWAFDLRAVDAILDAPDLDAPPIVPERVRARGTVDFDARRLSVDAFDADLPDGRFDAVFTFHVTDEGPTLAGAAHIGPSSVASLLGAWPPVMAHQPRVAMIESVRGGVVGEGDLVFALTPLELDGDPSTNDMIEGGLSIDITFAGATFVTPDLPVAVQRGRGAFRIRDKTLSVRLDGGHVAAGEGGAMRVRAGAMTIRTLGDPEAEARLSASVEGPISAVVALADKLGVPELKQTPLTPDDVEGTVTADLGMRTPLGPAVGEDERRWSIAARLTDAASRVPIAGQSVEDANIEVEVNNRRLAARGRARIDGLMVDINYSELFDGTSSGAARFVLTDKDRKSRGFDTGAALRGPVVITLEQEEENESAARRRFSADLTEAVVALPGFRKPQGVELSARGELVGEPAAMTVENLEVDGFGGVAISGRLSLREGALERLALEKFALSSGDDAEVVVERRDGAYRAVLEASRLDGRKVISSLTAPSGPETDAGGGGATMSAPVAVEARLKRVRLNQNNTVADLTVSAHHDGARLSRLTASGKINDVNAGAFAVRLKPAENRTRRLQADITALGRVLDALGVYQRMRGGRTTIDARLDTDGVVAGQLVANDFVLAGETTLEEIVERTRGEAFFEKSDGPLGFAPSTAIDGMSFDKLTIDFTRRGRRIEIDEAILRGPILGGTADGAIDLQERTIVLNGTLIPAYGVNNLFGRVPLFGEILGGGSKGGLIGVTFRLAGPIDDPQLVVNPMSAIAPGIFRRIFEFR